MKNPKVNYKIKRENYPTPIDITVDLTEIEKLGLEEYLFQSGIIDDRSSFEILNRFIVLPPKKDFTKKELTSSFESRPYFRKNSYNKKEDSRFRVKIHSVEYFNNSNYPCYIDLTAPTRGKAIIHAMNKLGFVDNFPDGWRNMEVIDGNNLSDYGIHQMGDENNIYKQRQNSSYHHQS